MLSELAVHIHIYIPKPELRVFWGNSLTIWGDLGWGRYKLSKYNPSPQKKLVHTIWIDLIHYIDAAKCLETTLSSWFLIPSISFSLPPIEPGNRHLDSLSSLIKTLTKDLKFFSPKPWSLTTGKWISGKRFLFGTYDLLCFHSLNLLGDGGVGFSRRNLTITCIWHRHPARVLVLQLRRIALWLKGATRNLAVGLHNKNTHTHTQEQQKYIEIPGWWLNSPTHFEKYMLQQSNWVVVHLPQIFGGEHNQKNWCVATIPKKWSSHYWIYTLNPGCGFLVTSRMI